MQMLRCHSCGELKEVTEFSKRSDNQRRGYQYACRKCSTLKTAEWRKNNSEKQKALTKNQAFKRSLQKLGITEETYYKTLEEQNGKCAICLVDLLEHCKDHSHTYKQFRGILCRKCNVGIGMFDENIYSLERAIEFLIKHGI